MWYETSMDAPADNGDALPPMSRRDQLLEERGALQRIYAELPLVQHSLKEALKPVLQDRLATIAEQLAQ